MRSLDHQAGNSPGQTLKPVCALAHEDPVDCGLLSFHLERLGRGYAGSGSEAKVRLSVPASKSEGPPLFGGWGENLEFNAILSYIVNLRLAWAPLLSLERMFQITK